MSAPLDMRKKHPFFELIDRSVALIGRMARGLRDFFLIFVLKHPVRLAIVVTAFLAFCCFAAFAEEAPEPSGATMASCYVFTGADLPTKVALLEGYTLGLYTAFRGMGVDGPERMVTKILPAGTYGDMIKIVERGCREKPDGHVFVILLSGAKRVEI